MQKSFKLVRTSKKQTSFGLKIVINQDDLLKCLGSNKMSELNKALKKLQKFGKNKSKIIVNRCSNKNGSLFNDINITLKHEFSSQEKTSSFFSKNPFIKIFEQTSTLKNSSVNEENVIKMVDMLNKDIEKQIANYETLQAIKNRYSL